MFINLDEIWTSVEMKRKENIYYEDSSVYILSELKFSYVAYLPPLVLALSIPYTGWPKMNEGVLIRYNFLFKT